MPSTTRTTLLLVATMALLIVGITMGAELEDSKTNLRLNNLNRLLTEGCPTGSVADGQACSSGADCASGYCVTVGPSSRVCNSGCGTSFVATGDDCSCCSGAQSGSDDGNGNSACLSPP